MKHDQNRLELASLAQHFDAPEGYVGQFGWLCGYSADASFLNDATERFTTHIADQRAQVGRIWLGLMLDPSRPALSIVEVPGVAHLGLPPARKMPFRLMHAKVAVLGFKHLQQRGSWSLRLIVSTGNWTRESLEQTLDLAWRLDLRSESVASPDQAVGQACADMGAAADLMDWLRGYYDARLLDASAEWRFARDELETWLAQASAKAKGTPRFFDSRSDSLLSQLPKRVRQVADNTPRNYLAMGSGFYESDAGAGQPPSVPVRVVKALRQSALLTNTAEIALFVNQCCCQAVATSVKALAEMSIVVRPPNPPVTVFGENCARQLHAKFLFSANYRSNSSACNNAWVYLGSGNLTQPGFALKMGADSGNLEAGVVFAPAGPLHWEESRDLKPQSIVTNLLPLQWTRQFDGNAQLSAGDPFEHPAATNLAPPVAWLQWHVSDGQHWLHWPDAAQPVESSFRLLTPDGQELESLEGRFAWPATRPRAVRCKWLLQGNRHEAELPVVDEFGRIAAAELRALDVDEAWWQLADFPKAPDEDDDAEDLPPDDKPLTRNNPSRSDTAGAAYPLRQMMELVECIAAKQADIDPLDWETWCRRLEQTLVRAKDSPAVGFFLQQAEPRLNPLSPLRCQHFRPEFAESTATRPGQIYEDTLARIEQAWGVQGLLAIGGAT